MYVDIDSGAARSLQASALLILCAGGYADPSYAVLRDLCVQGGIVEHLELYVSYYITGGKLVSTALRCVCQPSKQAVHTSDHSSCPQYHRQRT